MHADVTGLRMYYEEHGAGRPLVLLHGAFGLVETDFVAMIPALSGNHRVIAIEQQGHGHTADIDRPLTFEQMADDTAALLRQLGVDQADFFGYSMGGGVALQVAVRHPSLVRKIVAAGGTAYSPDGLYPEMLSMLEAMQPEMLFGTPWHEAYMRSAPRPENFATLHAKLKVLDIGWKGWPADMIRSIVSPVLVVIGDSDIVRPEHAVELFRLLGGGVLGDLNPLPASQLAVLPGTTHVSVVHKVEWLTSMALAFIDAPMPEAT
jgi:pimeloyl-ACP methyl ester carboxylesterase